MMYARSLFLLLLCLPLWAHAANENFNYHAIRQDMRKCMFPLCGGFFVHRVNKPVMMCADHSRRSECYVAEVDLSPLNPGEEQKTVLLASIATGDVLLRGTIEGRQYGDFGRLGVFIVDEVWNAATGADPLGVFYRMTNNGIVCITYPCPSLSEAKLNTKSKRNISGFDLDKVGADSGKVAEAILRLDKPGGLLVAGGHKTITGPGGKGLALHARQFYLPVASAPTSTTAAAPQQCSVGGCSGQICGDSGSLGDMITTCEWRTEYACYRTAKCEVQPDGKCGWTQSPELQSCLTSSPAP